MKTKMEKQRDFLEAENLRLRRAIEWALGAREDFEPQGESKAKYWWRKELSERAGLVWDGERYVDA